MINLIQIQTFNNRSYYLPTFIFLVVLFLAGCNFPLSSLSPSKQQQDPQSTPTVEQMQNSQQLLAVKNGWDLILVDPAESLSLSVYQLQTDQQPITDELFTFQVSPSKKYIVWYSPLSGILKLNLQTGKVDNLRSASKWLNQYPYLSFHGNQDKLSFIDEQGSKFFTINLESNAATVIDIPYPFGNLFRISPNLSSVLFISGFLQNDQQPQYLITTIQGTQPILFTQEISHNKRSYIDWHPDSTGIVMVNDQNKLIYLSISEIHTPNILHEFGQNNVTNFYRHENKFFVQTDNSKWHVYDPIQRARIASIPLAIAQELHRPKFYPWYDRHFLIVETLRLDPEQFNRLWISDYVGVKTNILDKYAQTEIFSDTPNL